MLSLFLITEEEEDEEMAVKEWVGCRGFLSYYREGGREC